MQKKCYFVDPLPHPFLYAPATPNAAMYYCTAALSGDAVRFRLDSSVRAIPKFIEKNHPLSPSKLSFIDFLSIFYTKFLTKNTPLSCQDVE